MRVVDRFDNIIVTKKKANTFLKLRQCYSGETLFKNLGFTLWTTTVGKSDHIKSFIQYAQEANICLKLERN